MTKLYSFDKNSLEYKEVNMVKTLFWIYFPVILAILFNYLFFRAEFIEDWQWKAEPDKELKKENIKITIHQWLKQ